MIQSEMEAIAPGNPFVSDAYNMGVQIGSNVMVMMGNHADKFCDYLIVVDTTTGKRIRITFNK